MAEQGPSRERRQAPRQAKVRMWPFWILMGGILGVTTLVTLIVGAVGDFDDNDTTERRAVRATPEVVTKKWCDKHPDEVDAQDDLWLTCFMSELGLLPSTVPRTEAVPVSYDLTGHGSVRVTMSNASGDPDQLTTPLPYHLDLGGVEGFVFLSAQLHGEGTVTCTIKQGDRVVQTVTSSGHDRIATCFGIV